MTAPINADARRNDRLIIMAAAEMYFADIALLEPALVKLYDETKPRIARALDEK